MIRARNALPEWASGRKEEPSVKRRLEPLHGLRAVEQQHRVLLEDSPGTSVPEVQAVSARTCSNTSAAPAGAPETVAAYGARPNSDVPDNQPPQCLVESRQALRLRHQVV